MATCLISKARGIGCKDGIGGIFKIFFANYNTITPTINSDGIVTNFTSGSSVYEYQLNGISSKFVQEMTSSRELGVTSVVQTATIDLRSVDALTNREILLLAYGTPQIYIQDNLGNTWLGGRLRGFDVSGNLDMGDALNSKYGYVLTAVAYENEYANLVSGSTFASPFGTAVTKPTIVVGA